MSSIIGQQSAYTWPESQDLFSLLTSDPIPWRLDSDSPLLDAFALDGVGQQVAGESEVNAASTGSAQARQAMRQMSNVVQDLSFDLASQVESLGLTADFLDTCLSCFFTRFVPIFPVMHQPTFSPRACTSTLLLNMIALGSLFVAAEGAVACGEALWRLAHTAVAVSWQSMLHLTNAEGNSMGAHLVMTATLGQAYAALSANRSLRLTSHVFNGLGFYWARQSGLTSTASVEDDPVAGESATDENTTARWKAWAAREVDKRALIGLYILDGLISQSSGLPTSVGHTVNGVLLPSSDEAFEAADVATWLTVITRDREIRSVTIRELLVLLFSKQEPFDCTSYSHMTVLALIEALQSLVAGSHAAGAPAVGLPTQSAISQALWRVYETQLAPCGRRPAADQLNLQIRWHTVHMNLCVESSTLSDALRQHYGVPRSSIDQMGFHTPKHFDLLLWRTSPLARRAVLHAQAILHTVQQLPLNRSQALHLPLALHTAAVVLLAIATMDQTERLRMPPTTCWRVVCAWDQDAALLPDRTSDGDAAALATAEFILKGPLPLSASSDTSESESGPVRNMLRDVNTVQTILESTTAMWGISGEMSRLLRQLVSLRKAEGSRK
ncbi:hypothetical protein LTR53_003906 [Teratosphaeriaceae sp. CCFEE 6253]|nr:hypothetical protein LTR53_003906 [Teratosphaeriaceae sp. CCFEE 6253]